METWIDLTRSVVWPGVVVTLAIIYHREVKGILRGLSFLLDRTEKVKATILSMSVEMEARAARADVVAVLPAIARSPIDETERDLGNLSGRSRIDDAYQRVVERVRRAGAKGSGDTSADMTLDAMAEVLLSRKIIPMEMVRALDTLTTLWARVEANPQVTPESLAVEQYESLARSIISRLPD